MSDRHNPYQPSCGNCRFARVEGKWQQLFCKRRAPQVAVYEEYGSLRPTPRTVFPVVDQDNWCGEWEPKS